MLQTLVGTSVLWADAEIGMVTFRGVITKIDRRWTKDGAVLVTIGSLAPTIFYDEDDFMAYGKVA